MAGLELKARVWIEKDGKPVIGKGGAEILRAIEKHSSLSRAARELGMSYRFAWMYINRMESASGLKVVRRERGGREGGRMVLTDEGRELLEIYERAEKAAKEALRKVSENLKSNKIK